MDVQRDVELDLDPELVWELVSTAEELETWLGVEVELEPVEGSTGRVVEEDGTERRLVVEEVEEGHRLAWRWWPVTDEDLDDDDDDEGDDGAADASRVEITVVPSGGGTRVEVVEAPVAPLPRVTGVSAAHTVSACAAERWTGRLLGLEVTGLVRSALVVR